MDRLNTTIDYSEDIKGTPPIIKGPSQGHQKETQ